MWVQNVHKGRENDRPLVALGECQHTLDCEHFGVFVAAAAAAAAYQGRVEAVCSSST